MNGTALLKEPIACSPKERRDFARLVRQGFDAAPDGLDGRIGDAKWLAFQYVPGDTLAAIAALKSPCQRYRDDIFQKAEAPLRSENFPLELGWVFVVPAHRGNRMAESLCRLLLARVPAFGVFATTRPDNITMIRILVAFGFTRAGKPYPRRHEELALFLRSGPAAWRPPPSIECSRPGGPNLTQLKGCVFGIFMAY